MGGDKELDAIGGLGMGCWTGLLEREVILPESVEARWGERKKRMSYEISKCANMTVDRARE